MATSTKIIRVGVIGAGMVSQVVHLPTLLLLDKLYTVVGICDVSKEAVLHAQKKFNIPFGCQSSFELCSRSDIDLIIVASADEYHASQAIQAASCGKAVFIEKPMSLTHKEANEIEQARIKYRVHISVAYMRRYTSVFGAFLEELERAGPTINFARVFDYIGPNDFFVAQSATMSKIFSNDIPNDAIDERKNLSNQIASLALGETKGKDQRLIKIFRLLGSLGSHDLSCMRHAFKGVPKECLSAFASPSGDFIGATFTYEQEGGTPFMVSYETGIHEVGVFDAFIEVYCSDRIIKLTYDTPFVKGLPITLTVRENTGQGYQERYIRPTYVDAYTAEFIRLHKALTGKAPVTGQQSLSRNGWAESREMCSPRDSQHDLDVFDMIMKHLN
jgi:predicted dehydrogenase